jgi:HSP20 family molecular chaperone IbpA
MIYGLTLKKEVTMSLVKFRNNFPSLINEFIGKDMDELFNFDGLLFNRGFVPAVNVREDNDNFYVEVAVPGMKKKDFKVTLDNCVLTISAEKQHKSKEKEEHNGYTGGNSTINPSPVRSACPTAAIQKRSMRIIRTAFCT